MSIPIAIPRPPKDTFDDHAVSTSPPVTRHRSEYSTSPHQSSPTFGHTAPVAGVRPKVLKPFATEEIRLLILENISQDAVRAFTDLGFQVDFHKKAFSEAELVDCIGKYHAIGIRSKTKITARVLKAATKVSSRVSLIFAYTPTQSKHLTSSWLSVAFVLVPTRLT